VKDLSDDILPEQELVNLIFHRFNNTIILITKDGGINQVNLSTLEVRPL
jgi:hypothetical protein